MLAFFLLGKHKLQVYLVIGIVFYKNSVLGALGKEVIEVLALLDHLIYGELQFRFP